MSYRDDHEAQRAKNEKLEQAIVELTEQLGESRRRVAELRREVEEAEKRQIRVVTPRWAWPSAVGGIVLAVVVLLMFSRGACAGRDGPASAPRAAPTPPAPGEAPPPAASVAPVAPVAPSVEGADALAPTAERSARAAKLDHYRLLVDIVDHNLAFLARDYAAMMTEASRGRGGKLDIAWSGAPFVADGDLRTYLGLADQAAKAPPALGELDVAVTSYVEQARATLPELEWAARYFEGGDHLDDDLAAAKRRDPALRGSLAALTQRSAALRATLEGPWSEIVAERAREAPGSLRTLYERSWEACRAAASLVIYVDKPAAADLKSASIACRAATDALYERRDGAGQYYLGLLDGLNKELGAAVREGAVADRSPILQLGSYAASEARRLRTLASTTAP